MWIKDPLNFRATRFSFRCADSNRLLSIDANQPWTQQATTKSEIVSLAQVLSHNMIFSGSETYLMTQTY